MDDTNEEENYETERIDMRNVPKSILKDLIHTYKAHPALWQIKNKHIYNNRNLKARGYLALVKVWKKHDPSADPRSVRMKIQSLRGSFRKELNKVRRSQEAGGPIYQSHLWYFNMMTFLVGSELPKYNRGNKSKIDDDSPCLNMDNTSRDMDAAIQDMDNSSMECPGDDDENKESVLNQYAPVSNSHYQSNGSSFLDKRQKALEERERRLFMAKCTDALDSKMDDCEAFGQYISTKLSKVENPEQKMYAEVLITKILNKATLNRLTEYTDINDICPTPTEQYCRI